MTTASTTKAPRDTLNLRIPPAERNLIDRAAEETLLDRALMVVSPEAYDEFLQRLDRPAQPNDRLKRTMAFSKSNGVVEPVLKRTATRRRIVSLSGSRLSK